jgi:ABC-2 type transport system permease protein
MTATDTSRSAARASLGRGSHHVGRLWEASAAFFSLGWRQAISYPLGFFMSQISNFLPILIFFFVSDMVTRPGQSFGGDYFSSVVIGLIGVKLLDSGLRGFGAQMDIAINRGWLEMFLVEPVRWRFLPFAMSQWPNFLGVFAVATMLALALALGASFEPSGIPMALAIGALGMFAGLAIGTMSASIKVLAKSGDPVLLLYTLMAQLFSGVYFPVDRLPTALRWLSYLFPHTYVIQGLRKALLPDGAELAGPSSLATVMTLLIFSVLAYPLAIWIWGRALEYGRKLGVLSGY